MGEELKINYQEFITKLNDELQALKTAGHFGAIKHLREIIEVLRDMQRHKFVPRTAASLHYASKDLIQEVNDFLDPYFSSGKPVHELITDIEKCTGGFFAFEKNYQLSHARRIWRERIDESEDVSQDAKNYFLSRIYTDCYETLPLALAPIIRHHWLHKGKAEAKVPSAVFDAYKFIIECLGKSAFSEIEIDQAFRKLRNDLSHASMLFKDNSVFVWEDDHDHKKRSRFDVFPQMKAMMDLLVIYVTELDIRIMEMAFAGGESHFEGWLRYFEKYVFWFNKNLGTSRP